MQEKLEELEKRIADLESEVKEQPKKIIFKVFELLENVVSRNADDSQRSE